MPVAAKRDRPQGRRKRAPRISPYPCRRCRGFPPALLLRLSRTCRPCLTSKATSRRRLPRIRSIPRVCTSPRRARNRRHFTNITPAARPSHHTGLSGARGPCTGAGLGDVVRPRGHRRGRLRARLRHRTTPLWTHTVWGQNLRHRCCRTRLPRRGHLPLLRQRQSSRCDGGGG